MLTIYLAIFLPFIAALIIFLFLRNFKQFHLGWLVLLIPGFLFVLLTRLIPSVKQGTTTQYSLSWIPSFDIHLTTYADGLSLLFALLITGIGTLVVLYSIYYLTTDEALTHFYIYLLLFMGSMLGIVFSDHLIGLYLFWELTSISSFLLIAFWYQRKGSRDGAKKALMITILGGFSLLAAFLMLYVVTGTFNIREIIASVDLVKNHPLLIPIMVLILLGAFTKSAQFPFHIWLPDAMEAPTPISAYLHSATMVKAGIFLVARFTPVFGGEAFWFWTVTTIGLITLFWGSLTAIRQTDLKALLAFSTVSQLGLIMSLFGIGSLSLHPSVSIESALYTQAAFAGLFHLVNHSTFKGSLFMVTGIIDYQLGTRDLRRLGGLMAFMPISFTVTLIGSFSMAGLPPFNGFLSKEMFFTAMLSLAHFDIFSIEKVSILFPVIAWIASVFTFVYSMIILFQTFLNKDKSAERTREIEPKEPVFGMLISPIILASLVVLLFFFPNVLGDALLKPAIQSIYPEVMLDSIGDIKLWHGFNTELLMTIGIILLGVIIYTFLPQFKKVYVLFPENLSFNNLYAHTIEWIDQISNRITSMYMTGYLRHYFLYIAIFFIITVGGVLIYQDAIHLSLRGNVPIGIFSWMLAISIVIAGVMILFVKSRLTAIIVNGYIGFSIGMFFVIFRAPDLALTQLIVETVTTALFLLCFYFLPRWSKEFANRKLHVPNLIVALGVGLVFTLVALSAHQTRLFESISTYFNQAEELTGGKNIVNTILADFRAFDTMLEVIVLFIAGIGIFTLIKYSARKGAEKYEDQ